MTNEEMGAFIRRLSDDNADLSVSECRRPLDPHELFFCDCDGLTFAGQTAGPTLWAALEALAENMEGE